MIAYLRGELLEKYPRGALVLTAGGVGYALSLTAPAVAGLPLVGSEVSLYVHVQTREDGAELFGFCDPVEREAFRALISVPKLGPKTAMAMLSNFSVPQLVQIAAREDVAALSQVPGIGKKSAQRMILELKYALDGLGLPVSNAASPDREPPAGRGVPRRAGRAFQPWATPTPRPGRCCARFSPTSLTSTWPRPCECASSAWPRPNHDHPLFRTPSAQAAWATSSARKTCAETSRSTWTPQRSAARPWTTPSFYGPPGPGARPPWPRLWPRSWASTW